MKSAKLGWDHLHDMGFCCPGSILLRFVKFCQNFAEFEGELTDCWDDHGDDDDGGRDGDDGAYDDDGDKCVCTLIK